MSLDQEILERVYSKAEDHSIRNYALKNVMTFNIFPSDFKKIPTLKKWGDLDSNSIRTKLFEYLVCTLNETCIMGDLGSEELPDLNTSALYFGNPPIPKFVPYVEVLKDTEGETCGHRIWILIFGVIDFLGAGKKALSLIKETYRKQPQKKDPEFGVKTFMKEKIHDVLSTLYYHYTKKPSTNRFIDPSSYLSADLSVTETNGVNVQEKQKLLETYFHNSVSNHSFLKKEIFYDNGNEMNSLMYQISPIAFGDPDLLLKIPPPDDRVRKIIDFKLVCTELQRQITGNIQMSLEYSNNRSIYNANEIEEIDSEILSDRIKLEDAKTKMENLLLEFLSDKVDEYSSNILESNDTIMKKMDALLELNGKIMKKRQEYEKKFKNSPSEVKTSEFKKMKDNLWKDFENTLQKTNIPNTTKKAIELLKSKNTFLTFRPQSYTDIERTHFYFIYLASIFSRYFLIDQNNLPFIKVIICTSDGLAFSTDPRLNAILQGNSGVGKSVIINNLPRTCLEGELVSVASQSTFALFSKTERIGPGVNVWDETPAEVFGVTADGKTKISTRANDLTKYRLTSTVTTNNAFERDSNGKRSNEFFTQLQLRTDLFSSNALLPLDALERRLTKIPLSIATDLPDSCIQDRAFKNVNPMVVARYENELRTDKAIEIMIEDLLKCGYFEPVDQTAINICLNIVTGHLKDKGLNGISDTVLNFIKRFDRKIVIKTAIDKLFRSELGFELREDPSGKRKNFSLEMLKKIEPYLFSTVSSSILAITAYKNHIVPANEAYLAQTIAKLANFPPKNEREFKGFYHTPYDNSVDWNKIMLTGTSLKYIWETIKNNMPGKPGDQEFKLAKEKLLKMTTNVEFEWRFNQETQEELQKFKAPSSINGPHAYKCSLCNANMDDQKEKDKNISCKNCTLPYHEYCGVYCSECPMIGHTPCMFTCPKCDGKFHPNCAKNHKDLMPKKVNGNIDFNILETGKEYGTDKWAIFMNPNILFSNPSTIFDDAIKKIGHKYQLKDNMKMLTFNQLKCKIKIGTKAPEEYIIPDMFDTITLKKDDKNEILIPNVDYVTDHQRQVLCIDDDENDNPNYYKLDQDITLLGIYNRLSKLKMLDSDVAKILHPEKELEYIKAIRENFPRRFRNKIINSYPESDIAEREKRSNENYKIKTGVTKIDESITKKMKVEDESVNFSDFSRSVTVESRVSINLNINPDNNNNFQEDQDENIPISLYNQRL